MLTQKDNEAWYKSIKDALAEGRLTPTKEVDGGTWLVLGAITPQAPGTPLPRWSGEFDLLPVACQEAIRKKKIGDRVQMDGNLWKVAAIFDIWQFLPKTKKGKK